MKCMFCEQESTVHIEIEPERDLEVCEHHFSRLRSFLGAPSVTISSTNAEPIVQPGYWNVLNPQDYCQHEFDMGISAPTCRKCGKPYHPNESYAISQM